MPQDNQVAIATLALYLYRQAGCPCGDNLAELNAWINLQAEIFKE